ncbi:MAG: hypothetical protein WCP11_02235 [Candidatus Saccharibacteria bacterium]
MDNKTSNSSFKDKIIRFNVVIFIVALSIIAMFCIWTLNCIITQSTQTIDDNTAIKTDKTSFDEDTKTQIQKLINSGDNSATSELPTGRINPFVE